MNTTISLIENEINAGFKCNNTTHIYKHMPRNPSAYMMVHTVH